MYQAESPRCHVAACDGFRQDPPPPEPPSLPQLGKVTFWTKIQKIKHAGCWILERLAPKVTLHLLTYLNFFFHITHESMLCFLLFSANSDENSCVQKTHNIPYDIPVISSYFQGCYGAIQLVTRLVKIISTVATIFSRIRGKPHSGCIYKRNE